MCLRFPYKLCTSSNKVQVKRIIMRLTLGIKIVKIFSFGIKLSLKGYKDLSTK